MTPKQRKAMEQALEALDNGLPEVRVAASAALCAALAEQPAEQEPVVVPLIDYDALIAAAYAANKKWAQGTNGCIAFKHGAEWFRKTLAAPPAPQPAKRQPLTREQVKALMKPDYDNASMQERADFMAGFRAAEAAHGITGETK